MSDTIKQDQKKILILATLAEIGGVQVFVRDLAKELAGRGLDVKVGLGAGDFLPGELSRAKIPWHRFRYLRRGYSPLAGLKFSRELAEYLRENRFSTIHINSSNALLGALGAKRNNKRIKTIFTVHGLSVLDEHYRQLPGLRPIATLYFKYLFGFVDSLVFVSRHNLETAQARRLSRGGTVIHNGIDLENAGFLDKKAARQAIAGAAGRNIGEDSQPVLGAIGRLSYQKNHEFLVNAFSEFLKASPGAKLIIIGGGPEKARLEKTIKAKGLEKNIFLAGPIANAASLIKAFDIFLLPSRYEGLPLTLIEAIAAGLPVLASAVGGNAEVLNGSEEQLYRLNGQNEFLEKLKRLAKDKDLREKISRQNREYSKNFTLEKMTDEYLKLYG